MVLTRIQAVCTGSLGPIPYPVLLMVGVFLVGAFILMKTRTGRYIYGVGGNEGSKPPFGRGCNQNKIPCLPVSGLLSGLAGLVLLARTNSGQPSAGDGYEMDAITAVVLGGVSIAGGKRAISGWSSWALSSWERFQQVWL